MTREWTARQLAFIEWLACPAASRKPKTQGALARKLGVSRETLSRWKKLPGFGDAVYAEVRRHLDGRLPEILARLGDKAEGGDLAAIRLALEVTGRFRDALDVNLRGAVAAYQAEDYAAAARFLEEWEREQLAAADAPPQSLLRLRSGQAPQAGGRSEQGSGW